MIIPASVKPPRRRAIAIPILASAFVVGGLVGLSVVKDAPAPVHPASAPRDVTGEARAEGIDLLRRRFFRPVPDTVLRRGTLAQIAIALGDRYTRYLPPVKAVDGARSDDGAYAGVGIDLAHRAGGQRITHVSPVGPAARAGIRPGELLVTVDGRDVRRFGVNSAVRLVRGEPGRPVALGIATGPGRPVTTIVLRRRVFRFEVARGRVVGGGAPVAVVTLTQFTTNADARFGAALRHALVPGVRGVVVDLRGNGGGMLEQAVAIAGRFLPAGTPVVEMDYRDRPHERFRTEARPRVPRVPIVMLVDHDSASASEVLTGALRDRAGATVVGTRTFGKGRVQIIHDLPDSGALKLTVATYRTPAGHEVDDRGIRPDVVVKDDPGTRRDEALDAAVAVARRAG